MTPLTATKQDFKVADLGLADYGRKEIELAEHEMPGLMATRAEYAEAQRPEHVEPAGWLRWEQDKHQRLLNHALETA